MLRLVLLFCVLGGFSLPAAFAQTPVLDSLQNALKTAKEDTNKVKILIDLAHQIYPKKPRTSLEYAEQATILAQRFRNKNLEAKALYYVATSHYRLSNDVLAIQACINAKKIADSIYDNQLLTMVLYRMGVIYNQQGNYEQGMVTLRKAKHLSEISLQPSFTLGALNGLTEAFINQKLFDSALVYAELNWSKTLSLQSDSIFWGRNALNLGLVYFMLKRYNEASNLLKFAIQFDEKIHNQTAYYVGNLINLGRVYCALGRYSESLKFIDKGLHLAKDKSFKNRIQDGYIALVELYSAQGQYKKAFESQQHLLNLKDSLSNELTQKKIAQAEYTADLDRRQSEIKVLQANQQQQQIVIYSTVSVGVLVGFLALVLFQNNRKKKRANDKLTAQKQLLESQAAQIQLANTELQQKNIEITEAHEETQRLLTNVNDSIRYAKRIQDAMLPSTETLNRLLPEHFIFFRPKDVVSGDFYWCKEVHGKVFVAAVDCTGHGVPGAFMSLIGNALLNDITQRLTELHPDLVLNELHHDLQRVLRQRETNNDDGMDICLCMIDLDTRIVEFAGTMNPLYAVVAGELREFKGTPEELGGRDERSPVYQRHSLDLSEVPQGATVLYLTSDGYKDQYNAEKQRFMPKRLRPLLQEIAGKPLEEQPRLLGEAIDAHRGDVMQVDDMLVLGVRL